MHHIELNSIYCSPSSSPRIDIQRSVGEASTGSVSTLAYASGDGAIRPSRHDMASSCRATASKGASAVDDHVQRGEPGYTDGVLNAQSTMYSRCNHNRLNLLLKLNKERFPESSREQS